MGLCRRLELWWPGDRLLKSRAENILHTVGVGFSLAYCDHIENIGIVGKLITMYIAFDLTNGRVDEDADEIFCNSIILETEIWRHRDEYCPLHIHSRAKVAFPARLSFVRPNSPVIHAPIRDISARSMPL